jgi:hypothetical protein
MKIAFSLQIPLHIRWIQGDFSKAMETKSPNPLSIRGCARNKFYFSH